MSEGKHTSEPWVSEATGVQPGAFSVVGDGQQLVALVYGKTREEQAANARLVSAAPALLKIAQIVARASMGETRPTRREHSIGWQDGDHAESGSVRTLAFETLAAITGAT